MRRLLGTTRGRLVAFSVAILGVALVITDAAVLGSLSLAESTDTDAVLVAQSHVLASTLEDVNGRLNLDTVDIPGETQAGIAVDVAVVSSSGVLVQTTAQPLATATLESLASRARAAQGPVWADLVDSRGVPRRAYAVRLSATSDPSAVLVVSRSVQEARSIQQRTLLLLLLVSAILLLVGGLLARWLAGRVLRPVRTIAGLARSISEHDLHRRVEVSVPPDELGELVDTFNAMLERLEGSFDSLRRFTSDASHELRAPLALMRSELEGTLTRNRSREEYKRVLVALAAEVDHLSRLADHLLILARADAGVLVPEVEDVDVADFLHEVGARWGAVAEQQGLRIEVAAPAAGRLRGDPRLIRRVLDNLLDNAVRHAPKDTAVVLRGSPAAGGWNLEVADQGPGVPAEQRARLFQRFARLDPARTREVGGAGLGLALSAAIARAHGGSLTLGPDAGPGAVFVLHLPS